jgi:hypothetical protein
MRLIRLLFVLTAFAFPARAATIDFQPMGWGAPDLIVVEGELFLEDAGRFQQVAARTSNAVVAFSGPGGNAVAAVVIGDTVRSKNFATVVLDGDECASGCALAWLGGTRRFRGQRTRIGFHAARHADSGNVSVIGNTIVRSYLHRMGFMPKAVSHLTKAAPRSMAWLTRADTRTLGIEVGYLAPATMSVSAPQKSGTRSAARVLTPLEAEAVAFLKDHAVAESQPLPVSLATVRARYASAVYYYGKYLSRSSVVEEYSKLTQKRPERQYSIRTDTIEARCVHDIGICDVSAILDWVAVSQPPGKTSAGHSSWTLGLVRQGGSLVIASVSGAARHPVPDRFNAALPKRRQ